MMTGSKSTSYSTWTNPRCAASEPAQYHTARRSIADAGAGAAWGSGRATDDTRNVTRPTRARICAAGGIGISIAPGADEDGRAGPVAASSDSGVVAPSAISSPSMPGA